MTQNRGNDQTHVTNGTIAAQRHRLTLHLWGHHVNGVLDGLGLTIADDEGVEIGMLGADSIYACTSRIRTVGRCHQQYDDTQNAAHHFERLETCL